jgi:hypothetical protein
MPGQTASVAQFPVDDRLQSLAGNLDSGFHGFSGDEPQKNAFYGRDLTAFSGYWTGRLRELCPPFRRVRSIG